MISDIKNTIKQSAIYGLSRISSKALSFVLVPLYTTYFSPFEYGILIRIEALWQILFAIYVFGIESFVVKYYITKKDVNSQKSFLFSILFFIFLLNLIFSLVFILFAPDLSNLLFSNFNFSDLIIFASIISTLEAFLFILFLVLRIKEKIKLYFSLSLLNTILLLLFQLYFLLYTSNKLDGVFISKILSNFLIVLLFLPTIIYSIKFNLNIRIIKDVLIFCFPIMVASLVSMLLNQTDKYLLGIFKSGEEVGYYGLAYNICGLINFFVIIPFSLSFSVLSWKKFSDENASRFYTKSITYITFLIFLLILVLSLFIEFLFPLFIKNVNFQNSIPLIPIIALSFPFYAIPFIGFFSFYVTDKTKYVFITYFYALVINVILNILLIPLIGSYGAAIANLVSFIFLSILTYFFSFKGYFIKYEWRKIILQFVLVSLIILLDFFIEIESLTLNLIFKITIIPLYILLLYSLNFFEKIEIETIKKVYKKISFK